MLNNTQSSSVSEGADPILASAPMETTGYNAVTVAGNSTLYSDSTATLEEPKTLFVSHELSKDKSRRNSVLIFKDLVLDADGITLGTNQVMIKLTTDLNVVSKQQVLDLLVRALVTMSASAFNPNTLVKPDCSILDSGENPITTTFLVESFLNGEH